PLSFHPPPTTPLYTLSLHDALPISTKGSPPFLSHPHRGARPLLPNHLHQHPLLPPPVKLVIKNMLPRPKVLLAVGDRDHNFPPQDRKSTRLNSSHRTISYAVFCLKK